MDDGPTSYGTDLPLEVYRLRRLGMIARLMGCVNALTVVSAAMLVP
jgi:hypothetical protein